MPELLRRSSRPRKRKVHFDELRPRSQMDPPAKSGSPSADDTRILGRLQKRSKRASMQGSRYGVVVELSIEVSSSGRSWQDVHRKLLRDRAKFDSLQRASPVKELVDPFRAQIAALIRLADESSVREGWVYMIPTVRLIEGKRYCKIGFSTDPDERFKSLCTNNPHALDLLNVRAFRGNLAHESTLKVITAAHSTDGANEWRAFPTSSYALLAELLPRYYWRNQPFL